MSKPREFWIKGVIVHDFEVVNSLRVIEKSAYDKATKDIKTLKEMLVDHGECSECLDAKLEGYTICGDCYCD